MIKKWIVAIVILIIVGLGSASGILYTLAKNPQEAEYNKVAQLVENQGLMNEITDIYSYNSTKSFITVIGISSEGEPVAYIVDKENYQSAFEVKLDTGISKEQAITYVEENNDVKEVLFSKLGYEEIGPVWEITYLNDENALSYTYLHFETGEWWKRISNL